MKKSAVVLAGCGYLDGAEIHEAVLSYLAMAKRGISYHSFSVFRKQASVINHLTLQAEAGTHRTMIQESARIARSDISELSELNEENYDILWLPGGNGMAKNFSSFVEEGPYCSVDPELARVIKAFYKAKKPIVAICIAPVIVARVLGGKGIHMTLGSDPNALKNLEEMGQVPVSCKAHEFASDPTHRVYTAPGYMEPPNIAAIYESLEKIAKTLSN